MRKTSRSSTLIHRQSALSFLLSPPRAASYIRASSSSPPPRCKPGSNLSSSLALVEGEPWVKESGGEVEGETERDRCGGCGEGGCASGRANAAEVSCRLGFTRCGVDGTGCRGTSCITDPSNMLCADRRPLCLRQSVERERTSSWAVQHPPLRPRRPRLPCLERDTVTLLERVDREASEHGVYCR